MRKATAPSSIAVDHRAGRRAVDSELVLDPGAAHVVAPREGAGVVRQKFRREKQRNAARAGGRVGKTREHEMHDIGRKIMLAIGDENLLAEEAVGAVVGAFGARAHQSEIGSRAGLSQIHRRRPFAADDLAQIGLFQRVAGMRLHRLDRAMAEQRADGESHVGGVPNFRAAGVEQGGEVETAKVLRSRDGVPAAVLPLRIGLTPAGGRRDGAIGVCRADAVADPVERQQNLFGEFWPPRSTSVRRRRRRGRRMSRSPRSRPRRPRGEGRRECRQAARGRSSEFP